MVWFASTFGYDCFLRPLDAKRADEFFDRDRRRLSNGKHVIDEPREAQLAQFVVEHFAPELLGEKGHVFEYGEPNAPLLVLGEFDNGRKERLGELLDPDHVVHRGKIRNYIQPHVGALKQ